MKLIGPTQRLMQLKFAKNEPEYQLGSEVFNVLKTGLGLVSILSKYESTGDNAATRVGKDAKDVLLSKVGAAHASLGLAVSQLKKLRHDHGAPERALFSLQPELAFADVVQSNSFMDSLAIRCSELLRWMVRCTEAASKVTQGFETDGESFWRADIAADADASALKLAAKDSIKKLDGPEVKSAVDKLEQAGSQLSLSVSGLAGYPWWQYGS